jgi:MFS family permease
MAATSDSHRADFGNGSEAGPSSGDMLLFWGCFIALIATAFGFIVRTQIINDWGREFDLNFTQKGELFGVGLWPFAISIILFSLIIDKIGYGKAMAFAFLCHVVSAVVTIMAPTLAGDPSDPGYKDRGYWILYFGTFIVALGNGTVEAVINPVVATIFRNQKTKWLNILHAGWPGGLVLGGLLSIGLGDVSWQFKVALLFIPVVAYGAILSRCRFPINERVAMGGSYLTMLQQVGALGALIVVGLIVREVGRVFVIPDMVQLVIIGALVGGYGLAVRSLGSPLFIILMLIMIPLATTELGTDSWITPLMESQMTAMSLNPGLILIYTSLIMMVLRFSAGPIVHRLSPLGLLALSAALAAGGLVFLSQAQGAVILAAATLYGLGKTFFWPTMLGVVSEQYPEGGALTLNTMGGVGMLAVGVLGNPFLGFIQDTRISDALRQEHPAIYELVTGDRKASVFGEYTPIDAQKVDALLNDETEERQAQAAIFKEIRDRESKRALLTVALLPCLMLVSYIGLIVYFATQGGYKPKSLSHAEEAATEY